MTTKQCLNLNLTRWSAWTHPLVMFWASPGARSMVQVQEWLRGQTACITNATMPNWRESDTQGPTASTFLYVSLGMDVFWLIWLLACPASIIDMGTPGTGVTVTGRLEGLLNLWWSVLGEVSCTLMPLTQEISSIHRSKKKERELT